MTLKNDLGFEQVEDLQELLDQEDGVTADGKGED